ncbi:MAG TPA: peptidoglycan DD-metalloendopeptidase family protein [Solirubrobacterales bacterium]|nr:peptidoglycan DD-metalloendopeptidase family protein [Solirubrobacterales bacterium]
MRSIRVIGIAVLIAVVAATPARAEAPPAKVAALQVALKALNLYRGYVDGVRGPLTRRGVVAFQRQRGLPADGIAGPQTRRALGWRGRPGLGSRTMRVGNRGWDVAALQFLLQRAGHGPGRADGVFGPLTKAAVLRAQGAAGIAADGLAGPTTIASLRSGAGGDSPSSTDSPSGPVRFLRPVAGPMGDGFGAPRTGYRHQGIDFPVPEGTRVGASGVGTTIFAGYNSGGFGNLVVIQHRLGYTTWYAHLSSITSWVGEQVEGGTRIGYVGSTGRSTGPHLHFEVRRYDTPVDPAPLFVGAAASSSVAPHHEHYEECVGTQPEPGGVPPGGDWIAREPLCVGEPALRGN